MVDKIGREERSALMAKVRSTGNRSTERKVEDTLNQAGINGWEKHPARIPGCPDFYFTKAKLAVFIDGCFWHACPKCRRPLPAGNAEYWTSKIDANRRRDNRIRRELRMSGFQVIRIWEHDLRREAWFLRLMRKIKACHPPLKVPVQ